MSADFSNLRIKKLIVHEIFKRNENREIVEPAYSHSVASMDLVGLVTLQKRIMDAIGRDSHAIEMFVNENTSMCTFDICTKLLDSTDDGSFTTHSKYLAKKLTEAQSSRSIPGGIVVILTGLVGISNKRFIAVIKAELHDGFGKNNDDNIVNLNYYANLALTPQQKLYKIGFIIEESADPENVGLRAAEDFIVYVYDHNISKDGTTELAQYFYGSFLGCSFTRNGKKLTKDFYNATVRFINNLQEDEEKKIDLISSLHSYLKVHISQVVEPVEFANSYFSVEQKDAFMSAMDQAKVPREAFIKDLSYIADKLKKRKLTFSTKVKILAPSDNFDDLVKVLESNSEKTILSIKGSIVGD